MNYARIERMQDEALEGTINDRMYNIIDGVTEATLHRFYLYDKKKNGNSMQPFLYAYTKDDDIAAEFKQARNPDLFIYKHSKESIDVISDIEFHHPEIRLRKTALKTRSPKNPSKTTDIPMVLTCDEERNVVSAHDNIYNLIGIKSCMHDMTVLSTGLNHALKDLQYFSIFRYMSQMQYIDATLGHFYDGVDGVDMGRFGSLYGMEPGPLPEIIADEFSVFVFMYGRTLRG